MFDERHVSEVSNWQMITIGSSNGQAPNRQQAIIETNDYPVHWCIYSSPGVRPTHNISIEFKIQPKFAVLWLKMYSTNHNEILYTAQHVQNFVVIGWTYFEFEHSIFWSNLEFVRNTISGMGAWAPFC